MVKTKNAPGTSAAAEPALVALTEILAREGDVFDRSPVGVVVADMQRRVRYANAAALAIVGRETYEGLSLNEAFSDNQSQQTLDDQWLRRSAGMISAYRAHVTRPNDSRRVLVEVVGIPLVNKEGGVVAALALIRRPDDSLLIEEIHRLNGAISDPWRLLREVCARLIEAFDADMAIVTRYSGKCTHALPFFRMNTPLTQRGNVHRSKQWIQLNDAQQLDVATMQTRAIVDLSDYLERGIWKPVRDDPLLKAILGDNQRGTLSRPIREGGQNGPVKGTISLLSRTAGKFGEAECKRINELPLETTVLQAIGAFAKKRESERFKLLKELTKCTTVKHAGETLAEGLVEFFSSSYAALFRVDHADKEIRLVGQPAPTRYNAKVRLKEDEFQRPIGERPLGEVVETREPLNVGNLPKSARNIGSMMCWPIARDDKVRFIISVEDDSESAFADDEFEWMGEIAGEVAALLERISRLEFLHECFRNASDPIIVTDANYEIRMANDAAAKLMRFPQAKDITGKFSDLFEDEGAFERALRADVPAEEAQFRISTKGDVAAPVPVHLSSQKLLEVGGWIFILRDLRELQTRVELELLSQATFEIAAQTKAPLSLAMASLQQMRKGLPDSQADGVEKVLRHLRRVEQSFSRLALFNRGYQPMEADSTAVSLGAELRAIVDDLPEGEKGCVKVSVDDGTPHIRAERAQIVFVLETLLSTLIRCAPEEEPVLAEVARDGDRVALRLRGYWMSDDAGTAEAVQLGSDLRQTLWLARPVIEGLKSNHGAQLDQSIDREGLLSLALSFPVQAAAA